MGLPEETANSDMVKAFDPFDLTWRTGLLYIGAALALTLLEAPPVYWVGAWLACRCISFNRCSGGWPA